jgi:ribosomal-protein-alanine N-acetyltransferase
MWEEENSIPIGTRLEGARVILRAPKATDLTELRSLLLRNADHLRPWSPAPPPGINPAGFTELGRGIARQRREWKEGGAYVFVVALRAPREPLVGRVALTALVRGPFQCAHLGYWVDVAHERQGLTSEAVAQVVAFAFQRLRLHRVQAAVMPHNAASRRLLAKLRFREEGFAKRYLRIGGKWEDHLLYGLTVEEWTSCDEGEQDSKVVSFGG